MYISDEIEIKMLHTGERTAPHLVVSLDCLASMMLENPTGPTECDVADVMALICRAAAGSGRGDTALANAERRKFEEEARGDDREVEARGDDREVEARGDDREVEARGDDREVVMGQMGIEPADAGPVEFRTCGDCGWPNYCNDQAQCDATRGVVKAVGR